MTNYRKPLAELRECVIAAIKVILMESGIHNEEDGTYVFPAYSPDIDNISISVRGAIMEDLDSIIFNPAAEHEQRKLELVTESDSMTADELYAEDLLTALEHIRDIAGDDDALQACRDWYAQ